MEFSDFFGLFEDLVKKHSDATASKLLYLKAYLRGSALDLIKYLSNDDDNYQVAVAFLKKEFLDKDVLIETHIRRLYELQTPSSDFTSMRSFMNSARASVYELKALGYDAIEEDCLGSRIISFMLCEKLPPEFKSKLSIITGTDTPSTQQLMENYSDVIRSLQKLSPSKKSQGASKPATKPPLSESAKPVFKQKKVYSPPYNVTKSGESVSTFHTTHSAVKFKPCKLCEGSHSMLKCTAYADPAKGQVRLSELKLCTSCSGQHKEADCPGKAKWLTYPCGSCGARTHITALCRKEKTTLNHLCLASRQQGHQTLLPITSVVISSGGQAELARALLDHGSQCSYISKKLAENLEVEGKGKKENFTVKTCIGTQEKVHEVVTCEIAVTPNKMVKAEFLIDPDMDLKYTVPGTHLMIQKLKQQGVKLADCFYRDQQDDTVDNISCLLGINTLTHLKPLTTTSLGQGTVCEVQKGLILFGDPMKLVSDEEVDSDGKHKQTASQSAGSTQHGDEAPSPSGDARLSHQHNTGEQQSGCSRRVKECKAAMMHSSTRCQPESPPEDGLPINASNAHKQQTSTSQITAASNTENLQGTVECGVSIGN